MEWDHKKNDLFFYELINNRLGGVPYERARFSDEHGGHDGDEQSDARPERSVAEQGQDPDEEDPALHFGALKSPAAGQVVHPQEARHLQLGVLLALLLHHRQLRRRRRRHRLRRSAVLLRPKLALAAAADRPGQEAPEAAAAAVAVTVALAVLVLLPQPLLVFAMLISDGVEFVPHAAEQQEPDEGNALVNDHEAAHQRLERAVRGRLAVDVAVHF